MKRVFSIFLTILGGAWAVSTYRFCAPDGITDSECNSLSRGDSRVICERITDSTECALKLHKGHADFGVFNAEELLLTYQFYPDEIKPIAQLKHKDRPTQPFEFQTVVVVPDSYNSNEGLRGLKNGGLCHPGIGQSQSWNDNILKFFERKSWDHECRADASVGENEAINVKNFFGKACRPGEWVFDKNEDKTLKKKYPELCELCDNRLSCTYHNGEHSGHYGALECLASGRGKAAYASYDTVYDFFGVNLTGPEPRVNRPGFQFLCPNGSLRPLTSSDPCAWISQPWSVIVARNDVSSELIQGLKDWLRDEEFRDKTSWKSIFKHIIEGNDPTLIPVYFSDQPTVRSYLTTGREVDINPKTCGNTIRWCTISPQETNKCKWVAKEALFLGIDPKFTCVETNSTFECLRAISENLADIITIDSHYGHLARTMYNLTSLLYAESNKNDNSAVLAVIKDSSSEQFISLKSLKNKIACFPEYGGIAWLSLINTVKNAKIISDTCYYSTALADLFSGACIPGINDANHSKVAEKSEIVDKLCSNCPTESTNLTCSANSDNIYYGDHGVLECLDGPGDVGFVEAKNVGGRIRSRFIDSNDYRVLCKNGSLAVNTGFEVDENCALSVTIDSEIVSRWNNSLIEKLDTTTALLKLENWLGYSVHFRHPIRIYDSYKGERDLLFKDSTTGLETKDSEVRTISAYRELLDNIESCKDSGVVLIISNILIMCLLIFVNMFN